MPDGFYTKPVKCKGLQIYFAVMGHILKGNVW